MDIHDEVNHLLSGIEFERAGPASPDRDQVKQRLRAQMVREIGARWESATIDAHEIPGGPCVYVIALNCPHCRRVHTFVAYLNEQGAIKFAQPRTSEE